MGFSLEKQEEFGEGIGRLFSECVEKAFDQLNHLSRRTRLLEEPCHEARKDLKRVRSCLRLVRGVVGSKVFRDQNRAYRDVGALLREVRDAHVLPQTLKCLLEHYQHEIKPTAFRALEKGLKDNILEKERELRQKAKLVSANRRLLKQKAHEFQAMDFKNCGWKEIKPNLKRIYSCAKDSYAAAYQDCTDDAFHEWRKQMKYLRYSLEALEKAWDEAFTNYVKELHDLTDLLGDDHDIVQLRLWLQEKGDEYASEEPIVTLFALMERRQEEFRAKARPIGNYLLAESPKAFMQRIKSYWKSWHMKDDLEDVQTRRALVSG